MRTQPNSPLTSARTCSRAHAQDSHLFTSSFKHNPVWAGAPQTVTRTCANAKLTLNKHRKPRKAAQTYLCLSLSYLSDCTLLDTHGSWLTAKKMLEFEFIPHFLPSSLSISSPYRCHPLQGRAWLHGLRRADTLSLCMCVCMSVRATGRASWAGACVRSSPFEASSNPARLLLRLRPREAADWSIFRSIHGCQSRTVLSVLPTSPYLPLPHYSYLSLLTRDYIR